MLAIYNPLYKTTQLSKIFEETKGMEVEGCKEKRLGTIDMHYI